MTVNVVILAGARGEGMGNYLDPQSYRAGLVLGGHSLLEQVLAAVDDLPDRGRIVLVGPEDLIPADYQGAEIEVVAPAGDLYANLVNGLAVLPPDEPALVAASDLPLLTRTALTDFLANCAKRQAELYYPILRREVYEAAYPGSARTYLTVRDGVFTGGNVVLLTPAVVQRHADLIAKAITWRKRPYKLGRLLGLGFLIGLVFHRRTIAEIEARVAGRLGLNAVAIETRFSEIGYDVDTAEDMQWVEFYWGGTLAGSPKPEAFSQEDTAD